MASTDSIAYLGDTIRSLLQDGLATSFPPPAPPIDVRLSTPDDFRQSAPPPPSVTIFLYHVAIATELRNAHPGSLAGGAWKRPPLPLELRFLVTPWTNTARDAYRIVGVITQLFYDNAVLSFSELQGDKPGEKVWAQGDTVEIVMESLPVEELYDIWDPTDIPYKLSLTYLARFIGIDSAVSTTTPPVNTANFPKVIP